jgi:hypothetical protein
MDAARLSHRIVFASSFLGLLACKVPGPNDEPLPIGGMDETSTSTSTSTGDPDESSSSETTATFVPDVIDDAACDPWAQDCPQGEKCVPYGSDGGNWDANKCVPVIGEGAIGDVCTYDGTSLATDSCGPDSHCWDVQDVDGELLGVCTPFCQGDPDDPICGPDTSCLIANGGSINLCITTCDPLLQECGENMGCFWSGNDFQCIFTAGEIMADQPCGFINDCAPGNLCASAELLVDCSGAACCTPFCDLGDPACPNPGTECVTFFEEGTAPPNYENVGVCVIPGA